MFYWFFIIKGTIDIPHINYPIQIFPLNLFFLANSKLITNPVIPLSNNTSTTISSSSFSYFSSIFTITSLNIFSFFSVLSALILSLFHLLLLHSLLCFLILWIYLRTSILVLLPAYSLYFYKDRQYTKNLYKKNISFPALLFFYLLLFFFSMLLIISTPFWFFFPLLLLFLLLFSTHHLLFFFLLPPLFPFFLSVLLLSIFSHFIFSSILFLASFSFSDPLLPAILIVAFIILITSCCFLVLASITLLLPLSPHLWSILSHSLN